MTHPRIPLAPEQVEAILALGPKATPADVIRVRREFNERRDQEFPGWRGEHEEAVRRWANLMGASA